MSLDSFWFLLFPISRFSANHFIYSCSVDKETAETMERVVAEECQEHTIIAIIHRLESIKYYDRIINIDNGKLIAEGT
jgi:ABC-type multidrug transport system fused ATPase/permease subunit